MRGARTLLAAAFSHPGHRDFSELVEWLAAANRIGDAEHELADFSLSPSRWTQLRRALFAHFEKHAQAAPAAALLDAHREIVEPGLLARLRALAAGTGSFAGAVAALEKLARQDAGEPALQLALLLADWAEADLVTGQQEAALPRLRRAQELRPALFPIAQKLSALHRARGEQQLATETLERFLAVARDPRVRAQAERLLSEPAER